MYVWGSGIEVPVLVGGAFPEIGAALRHQRGLAIEFAGLISSATVKA
jgi:hypothetical protein